MFSLFQLKKKIERYIILYITYLKCLNKWMTLLINYISSSQPRKVICGWTSLLMQTFFHHWSLTPVKMCQKDDFAGRYGIVSYKHNRSINCNLACIYIMCYIIELVHLSQEIIKEIQKALVALNHLEWFWVKEGRRSMWVHTCWLKKKMAKHQAIL